MTRLTPNFERHWSCAYPGCKHAFTSTTDANDKYYCKKHRHERAKLVNKIRYHVKKNSSVYYRRKRVNSLKRLLGKQEKIEKEIFTTLQIHRGKMQSIVAELDMLEKMGVRV